MCSAPIRFAVKDGIALSHLVTPDAHGAAAHVRPDDQTFRLRVAQLQGQLPNFNVR